MFMKFLIILLSAYHIINSRPSTVNLAWCETKNCTSDEHLICGSNHVTYESHCALLIHSCNNTDLDMIHIGPCYKYEIGICRDIVVPPASVLNENICATDGLTYHNMPALRFAQCDDSHVGYAHTGKCIKKDNF
ncbi:hypothetical protein SNEBB_011338 [Seison nebaliae]|nr:hypothetical protein SNEBB_011338 [Seison nebaliae]